jgi:tetratricopeptide (TPR) repeat protein
MPAHLICCVSLSPATISSVPIFDYADANEELADFDMFHYYECCGKSICRGCINSCIQSGNNRKCPFCNAEVSLIRTDEEQVADVMKRVEANDAGAICELAHYHHKGYNGVQQDQTKAMELYARAADLGSSMAHYQLGSIYEEGGNLKKAKFYCEAAAMAGHEIARFHLGLMEGEYGNIERAVKHWAIAASGGEYLAMHQLTVFYEKGYVSRESIDSFLTAYNNSCAEMRSEARDAVIRDLIRVTSETNESTTATRRGGPDEELAHLFASIYHASRYRPL